MKVIYSILFFIAGVAFSVILEYYFGYFPYRTVYVVNPNDPEIKWVDIKRFFDQLEDEISKLEESKHVGITLSTCPAEYPGNGLITLHLTAKTDSRVRASAVLHKAENIIEKERAIFFPNGHMGSNVSTDNFSR